MKLCCIPVLMVLLAGCGTASRAVHLDTGHSNAIVFTPRSGAESVTLDDDEFERTMAKLARDARSSSRPQEAARRLFEMSARSGAYTYEFSSRRIIPLAPNSQMQGASTEAEVELTRAYLRWCERTGKSGDCLRLLTEGHTLDGDGRFALSMALAKGAVLNEMLEAFKDLTDPHAMVAAVLWTWTTYMVLITVPEPLSKGIAAVMTATLISYVGIDTFWNLIVGFRHLMEEAERATTFSALREAGERYGKIMGSNAARAFAMLAITAIGNTAPGLAKQVPKLPGAMHAAAQAETQMGLRLGAVGEVETVTLSAERLSLSLAPGAVAMAADARGSRRFSQAARNAAYEKSQDATGQAHCEYCDEELTREPGKPQSYEADHRKPYSKGGPSSEENLAPSCRSCNREKGAQELDTDWVPPKNR
ncbi:HNH endonuclease signature motif containing protein [Stigmatella sp. ncwal1]|uniref:HNH endonuclease signature motif containing protein n=2 Tax=Stigmatella ashevillensis TaxID=2995309 RepID=A0ABT5D9L1_9BACT|nr:HNH endonuclease signature motif containing protein [Stigmatella ashevillena]MDC0710367.1 HNH endonuclease signature motif containing protein [Stigmatella ashevillena]